MSLSRGSLHSMSGFGRGESAAAGVRVVCEIRSVNQRGLDISLSCADRMLWADPLLRRLVSASIRRGRVDVNVSVASDPGVGGGLLDAGLAERYGRELLRVARKLHLERPRADALLAIPGVVRLKGSGLNPKRLGPLIRMAFTAAMTRLLAMRRREGAALARDLGRRFDRIERLAGDVKAAWPAAAARQQDRLTARLKEALDRAHDNLPHDNAGRGDDRRAAREIAQAVERGDAAEELTRIGSHLGQCRSALAGGSPAGRKLEFLVQELQREANTTGAKSVDAGVTRIVLAMKEEVERVREQVANLE